VPPIKTVFDRWQSPLLSLPVDLLHQALHGAGPVRGEDPDFNLLLVEPTEKNLCSWLQMTICMVLSKLCSKSRR
jgi:hypothetical protein